MNTSLFKSHVKTTTTTPTTRCFGSQALVFVTSLLRPKRATHTSSTWRRRSGLLCAVLETRITSCTNGCRCYNSSQLGHGQQRDHCHCELGRRGGCEAQCTAKFRGPPPSQPDLRKSPAGTRRALLAGPRRHVVEQIVDMPFGVVEAPIVPVLEVDTPAPQAGVLLAPLERVQQRGVADALGPQLVGDWEPVVSQARVRQRTAEHAVGVHRDHVRLERARQWTDEEVAQAYREYFSVPERLAALTTQQALALRLFCFDGQAGRRGGGGVKSRCSSCSSSTSWRRRASSCTIFGLLPIWYLCFPGSHWCWWRCPHDWCWVLFGVICFGHELVCGIWYQVYGRQ